MKFFVGGLAPETTEDDMRLHFEQFGELADVAVMRDPYGIPRCFGFVQYTDPNGHTCNTADEHVICNKRVDVKAAVPKDAIAQGAAVRTNKIFVGGLSKASSADTLRAHFAQFGNVKEVLMKLDEAGVSRGFCFVEFDSEDSADLASQTKPQIVDDKEIDCTLARPLGLGKGKGKGKGFGKGFGKGLMFGFGAFGFSGAVGPMRSDAFGKGARPSPYGAPVYAAPYAGGFGGGFGKGGKGGFGRGAAFPGLNGAANGYTPYAQAAPTGYGASYATVAAPAYGAYGY
eukprot:TRINITY_DN431_c0_g1_i1.p1 TRINITY_DN431_c0_g1~~TRINITY_DN431_c0_g1_i1.p1  ORF type:complete len:297 (+),score=14.25 TRINITY_DN431_c0_g1_i1:34-891(+)